MTIPKLTEVFAEAPDWKKSFKAAKKADAAAGHPLAVGRLEVPKSPKPPPTAKPIRKGGPDNDPLKTATTGEVFETEAGTYFVFRGINQKYYAVFVDGNVQRAKDLGEHPGRKEAIDAVLADHDKTAAGIGEIRSVPLTASLVEMFLGEASSKEAMYKALSANPTDAYQLAVYADQAQEENSPIAPYFLFLSQKLPQFGEPFKKLREKIKTIKLKAEKQSQKEVQLDIFSVSIVLDHYDLVIRQLIFAETKDDLLSVIDDLENELHGLKEAFRKIRDYWFVQIDTPNKLLIRVWPPDDLDQDAKMPGYVTADPSGNRVTVLGKVFDDSDSDPYYMVKSLAGGISKVVRIIPNGP